MSKNIDENIVELRFDNSNFEKNVQTSMSTLEKLKRKLNFSGANTAIDQLATSAKNLTFDVACQSAEKLQVGFSTLGVVGINVISNITQSLIGMATQVANVVTGLSAMKGGFEEYQLQMGSIQTIMSNTSSKGTTLSEVNDALDELNTYADLTIYNFGEMTKNIGTFTAAGVDLDTAVASIKGIANLAAASGSSSLQASTAMYQLSQAIAAGKVQLMDWNSVVNAGMGGELFQNALKRTAEHFGTDVDGMIEKYGSFRESLTTGGWLTVDVLTETLKQISGAYTESDLLAQGYSEDQAKAITQLATTAENAATKVKTFAELWDVIGEEAGSGWTKTWTLIFGDYEYAKENLTWFANYFQTAIGNMSNARNSVLEKGLESNWDRLIEQIKEAGYSSSDFTELVEKNLTQQGYDVTELKKQYGTLEKMFKQGVVPTTTLTTALNELQGSYADLSEVVVGIDWGSGFVDDGLVDSVKLIQSSLKTLGYDLGTFGENADGIDGQYGDMTQAAVMAFQSDHSLEPTGIVDSETLTALQEAVSSVDSLSEKTRTLIDDIDELGGRDLVWQGITNIVKFLGEILDAVATSFKNVFGSIDSDQIYDLCTNFEQFTESLTLSDDQLALISTTCTNVFGAFKIVGSIVSGVISVLADFVGEIVKNVSPHILTLSENINSVVGFVLEWITEFKELASTKGFVTTFIDGVITTFDNLKAAITGTYDGDVSTIFSPLIDGLAAAFSGLREIFVESSGELGPTLASFIRDIFSQISDAFPTDIFEWLGSFISDSFTLDNIFNALGLVGMLSFVKDVAELLGNILHPIKTISKVIENISEGVEGVHGSIDSFGKAVGRFNNSLLKTVVVIGIMALIVGYLGQMPLDDVVQGVIALGVLAVFAVALNHFLQKTTTDTKAKTNGLFKAITVIAIMALLVGYLGSMTMSQVIQGISVIIVLELLLKSLCSLGDKTSVSKSSAAKLRPTILAFIAVVAVAAALLYALDYLDIDVPLETIQSLATVLIAFAAVTFILSKVGVGASAAIKGAAAFDGVVAIIAGVLVALGALMEYVPECQTFLDNGIDVLKNIATGLGEAISGFVSGLFSELPSIGQSLSDFMDAAQNFFSGVESVDTNLGSKVQAIADAICAMAGAEFINALSTGISKILGGDGGSYSFKDNLTELGEGLAGFGTAVANINEASFTTAANVAEQLGNVLNNIPKEGGICDLVYGTQNFDSFSDHLESLGDGLSKFGDKTKSMNADGASAAADVASAIATILPVVPTEGGLSDLIFGSQNKGLQEFGTGVGYLGEGLATFANKAGNIEVGEDQLEKVKTVVGVLVELQNSMPTTGGLMEQLFGSTQSFKDFTSNAVDLVTGLSSFATEANDKMVTIEQEKLDAITSTATALTDINEAIPKTGGVYQSFTGEANMGDFGENAAKFSAGLAVFANNVKNFPTDINYENLDKAVEFLSGMSDVVGTSGGTLNEVIAWFAGETDYDSFRTNAKKYAEAIVDFGDAVSDMSDDVPWSAVTSATSALAQMGQTVTDGNDAGNPIDKLVSWFTQTDQWDTFKTNAATYAEAICTFGSSLSDFTCDANPDSLASTMECLAKMSEVTSNNGSLFNDWGTNGSGNNLKTNLTSLGEGISGFAGAVTDVSSAGLTNAEDALEVMEKWGASEYLDTDFEAFGVNFASFGGKLGDFSTNTQGIDLSRWETIGDALETMNSKVSGISGITAISDDDIATFSDNVTKALSVDTGSAEDTFSGTGQVLMNNLTAGFSDNIGEFTDAADSACMSAMATIAGYAGQFTTAGNNIMLAVADGISGSSAVTSAMATAIQEACSSASSIASSQGQTIGYWLMQGFNQGIADMKSTINNTVSQVAASSTTTLKTALDINSPSRITRAIGHGFDEGLYMGIYDFAKYVDEASDSVANTAIDAISVANDAFDCSADYEPVIRPVVDLSNIQNGSKTIDSWLNFGSVSSVSAVMAERYSYASNDDIVSAIQGLSDDISNMPRNNYNVNGVTYDDGSSTARAVSDLTRAIKIRRRS